MVSKGQGGRTRLLWQLLPVSHKDPTPPKEKHEETLCVCLREKRRRERVCVRKTFALWVYGSISSGLCPSLAPLSPQALIGEQWTSLSETDRERERETERKVMTRKSSYKAK